MDDIRAVFDDLSELEVKILANITEFMSGETVSGFSRTRLISNHVIVKFLSKSPIIFTPGGVLRGQVSIQKRALAYTKGIQFRSHEKFSEKLAVCSSESGESLPRIEMVYVRFQQECDSNSIFSR